MFLRISEVLSELPAYGLRLVKICRGGGGGGEGGGGGQEMSRATSHGWWTNHVSRKINYPFHASHKNKRPTHLSRKYPLAP